MPLATLLRTFGARARLWPTEIALVLLSTDWILWVSWAESTAYVGLTREGIASAPEFNPEHEVTRDFETRLHAHHKRTPYWEHAA